MLYSPASPSSSTAEWHAWQHPHYQESRILWVHRAAAQYRLLPWLASPVHQLEDGTATNGPSSEQLNGLISPLPVGMLAPDFTLPQAPHSRLGLHSFGNYALVLVFYPMDWEPVSREQLILYQTYTDTFDRLGARLLGISIDHLYCHAAFAREAHIHFPLLADFQPRGRVARQIGVFRQAQGVSARALFVIDAQGVIQFSKAYPDQLNPGVDEVLTILEAFDVGNNPLQHP